jgi:hypothetical protein
MTLKEKFEDIRIVVEDRNLKLKYIDEKNNCINECIQIAENFAVNFANWYEFMVRQNDDLNQRFTPKELIEMFKKEKGL